MDEPRDRFVRWQVPRPALGHRRLAFLAASLVLASVSVASGVGAADVIRQVSVTIQTTDGNPVTGLGLGWRAIDGSARSSGCKSTSDSGRVTWFLPVTEIDIWTNGCSSAGSVAGGPSLTELYRRLTVPDSGPIIIDVGPAPEIVRGTLLVQMPDGTPVFDAKIKPGDGAPGSYHLGGEVDIGSSITIWTPCPRAADCVTSMMDPIFLRTFRTDADGMVRIWRFVDPLPDKEPAEELPDACYDVTYDDGELQQHTTAGCTPDPVLVGLPYMPVIRLTAPPVDAVASGSAVTVTVQAVDGTGDPISGQSVRLAPLGTTAAMADAAMVAGCSPRLSGKTGSTGRVTFRICTDRTRAWRADGPSLVAARPFSVLVRMAGSPGAPRGITSSYPSDGTVVMSWRAPRSRGASAITGYQVRWSTDRGFTWSNWKGTRLARKTSPKSLDMGTDYLFQVRAVNGSGGGATATVTVTLPG